MDINEVCIMSTMCNLIHIIGKKLHEDYKMQVGGFFQVQFYLTMKWFESRLKFQVPNSTSLVNPLNLVQNLKDDINLNSFLPSEITQIWSPELIFENTVWSNPFKFVAPFSSFLKYRVIWKLSALSITLAYMKSVNNHTRVTLTIH